VVVPAGGGVAERAFEHHGHQFGLARQVPVERRTEAIDLPDYAAVLS
jgi:hypothetical protein